MLSNEVDTGDRKFFAVLAIAVVVTLGGLYLWASYLKTTEAKRASSASRDVRRVLHLKAIFDVYECERDGRRVLTDRPCGTGVPVRVIIPEKGAE